MTHAGVFEGGGFPSLVARWMGWNSLFWCENNEYCKKLLTKRFPNQEGFGDIKTTDFKKYANRIDVLTGGFPCQPFSTGGEMLGEDDERYLAEEMLRATREIKPRWVVAENVRGFTARKFSRTFEHICSSLEAEGYKIQPLIIPASAIGAEHERYRVWIIAHSPCVRLSGSRSLLGRMPSTKIGNRETSGFIDFVQRNTMPYVCRDHDGRSRKLDEYRMHILGNMIVPQVLYQIFKSIEQYESLPLNSINTKLK